MQQVLSSLVRHSRGIILTVATGLVLNVGVAAAASPPTPTFTPPAGNAATQPGQVVVIVLSANDPRLAVLNALNTPVLNTPPDLMTGLTDPRVDTYAKRQALRDQYKGRINETTFNDELGDGVGLDQALSDAMRELRAKSK